MGTPKETRYYRILLSAKWIMSSTMGDEERHKRKFRYSVGKKMSSTMGDDANSLGLDADTRPIYLLILLTLASMCARPPFRFHPILFIVPICC